MKKKALVLADVNKELLEKDLPFIDFYYKGYSVDFNMLPYDELKTIISEYDILISEFDTIDKGILDAANNLELIVCCRGGVNTVIDVDAAESRGISVRNTPGRNSTAVAEYVIGQIICSDRYLEITNQLIHNDILQADIYQKPKEYMDSLWGMDSKSPYHVFRGRGLQNITLGVIGYGRVGRIVVEKAVAMGMKVLVYDPSVQDLIPEVDFIDFYSILRKSDVISLHCTNKKKVIMFSDNEFNAMKEGAVFINTARGDLVDEDALIRCVSNRNIKAILDVTQQEPLPLDHKLAKNKNIVLTPHIAGATDIVIDNGTRMAVAHILEIGKEKKWWK